MKTSTILTRIRVFSFATLCLGIFQVFESVGQCFTFSITPSTVFDEPGGLVGIADGNLNIGPCTNSELGMTAVLTTNYPGSSIQLVYNGNAFNFVGGEAGFPAVEGVTAIAFHAQGGSCGTVYNIHIKMKVTGQPDTPLDPNDAYNLVNPKIGVSGPTYLCSNTNGTYNALPPFALSSDYTYTISGGSGWKINGITTNTITTSATSIV